MSPSWMDGFTLDITNPEVTRKITYVDKLMCQIDCDGQIGYDMTELIVLGKHPKYGF